ncbi:alpha-amylase family protein [Humibacter ginsengisoli]
MTIEQVDQLVQVTRGPAEVVITTPAYTFGVALTVPRATLAGADGELWSDLSLIANVDRLGEPDEASGRTAVTVEEQPHGDVVVRVAGDSSAWASRVFVLRCTPDEIRAHVEVTTDADDARIADVTVFGGQAALPTGAAGTFRSGIRFPSLFVPTPTEPVQVVRPSTSQAQLGVVGDAEPGRLHGIFSPPPLVFGLGRPTIDPHAPHGPTDMPVGEWLGASVVAPVEELGFTTFRYDALDGGFLLRLAYEGHTVVGAGGWSSPEFVLRPAGSPRSAIIQYRDDVARHGWASEPGAAADWWYEPIFCGWGAQSALAVRLTHEGEDLATDSPHGFVLPDSVAFAADLARQELYDRWLLRLAEHGIRPGTVVIDDRWQAEYGTNTVDEQKWPDLRAWIDARHADGQHVLLWLKAWDPDGLPAELTVRDAHGQAVAADPSNPAYLDALAEQVAWMLSPAGLDADGFKVDFTQRAPSGRTLRAHTDGVWGIAALHRLVRTIHDAAKAVKPDALVVTHTVHPSFGDVTDMIRLNDVLVESVNGDPVPVVDQMRFRHDIAAAALPGHPIDTDQWPMPNLQEWLAYASVQAELGVPALYYVESIDNSREAIGDDDLDEIASLWRGYREARARRRESRGRA